MEFIKYPKVRQIGQDGTEDILSKGHVVVQPKVDGSNVAIYCFKGEETKIARRSGFIDFGVRQFQEFADFVAENEDKWELMRSEVDDGEGVILYGEYAFNQNKLKYDNKLPFILFDVFWVKSEDYARFVPYKFVKEYAHELDLPVVPCLYEGPANGISLEWLEEASVRDSFLGGCQEEGIVIKHYETLTRYNRPYFCKIVTEQFKEAIRKKHPQNVLAEEAGIWVADCFLTEARLDKAIQRLQEDGRWKEDHVRSNIGPIIGVVSQDIREEHWEEIKDYAAKLVWKSAAKKIAARVSPMIDDKMRLEMEGIDLGG